MMQAKIKKVLQLKINPHVFLLITAILPFIVLLTHVPGKAADNNQVFETPVVGTSSQISSNANQNSESFKSKLKAQYEIDSIQLLEGPKGPEGKFHINGKLTPKKLKADSLPVKPKEIALAFFYEHKELFGITDINKDIKEKKRLTDKKGKSHISFYRTINGLKLKNSDIIIHIDADGKIFSVNGTLQPIDSINLNNYSLTSISIKEKDAKLIIENDLKGQIANQDEISFNRIEPIATVADPYIVWEIDVILSKGWGRWLYTIDAKTGEIISKKNGIQYSGPKAISDKVNEVYRPNEGNKIKIQEVAVNSVQDTLTPNQPPNISAVPLLVADLSVQAVDAENGIYNPGDKTSYNSGYDGVIIHAIDTAGPKIGTGTGVLGDVKNHIDTYYEDGSFYLIDISRRSNTNPHNHDGQMDDDAMVVTGSEREINAGYLIYDDDNIWISVDQASGIDAHVYSGIVYDYLLSVLDLNSFDGNGNSMISRVDITSWEDFICNAGWDGFVVGYATCNLYLPFSGALDFVAHEWGHAVTEKAAVRGETLIYEKESGALNESFSDWLGVAVEHANGESNWTIGEGVYPARDLSDPTLYNDPDFYKGLYWVDVDDCIPDEDENDWCGVHTNNGVPNKMFYLLAAGGTHHDVIVTGIGITMAMKIAYKANMYYWTSTETFAGARQGMKTAAASFGQNAVEQTMNAWAAVGVGNPATHDLSVQAVDVENGTYNPGDLINVFVEIDNIGETTSPSYQVDFYASTNTTINTLDKYLGYDIRSGLVAGGTDSYTSTGPLPTTLAPGDYYIGIIVTCTGDNTSNNSGYDEIPIQVIMPVYCGDGIVNGTEQCDDGNQVNTDDCLNSCVIASCGDGFVQSGVEACDDGNTATGDLCDANCEIDTDGDGLNDNDEINIYNTSPSNPDSDNDGLNDGMEVNTLGTDPLLTDTDGNGTPDGDEDNDGDGFTNAEEVQCSSDPANPYSKCTMSLPWLMLLLD